MAATIALRNVHSLRRRAEIQLDLREVFITRRVVRAGFIIAGVGTLLALTVLLTAVSLVVWPAWICMLLPVIRPVYGVQSSRYLKRQFGEAGTAGSAVQSGPSASSCAEAATAAATSVKPGQTGRQKAYSPGTRVALIPLAGPDAEQPR